MSLQDAEITSVCHHILKLWLCKQCEISYPMELNFRVGLQLSPCVISFILSLCPLLAPEDMDPRNRELRVSLPNVSHGVALEAGMGLRKEASF